MGICFTAYALGTGNLEQVLADPPLVWQVLEQEDPQAYLNQLEALAGQSWLQRLMGRPAPRPQPRQLAFGPQELRPLELDKAWDGLRCCLQLCAPDAPDLFEGDGPVGDFEVGYGPALHVRADTLARYAAAIAPVDEAALLASFARADFHDVYLAGLWQRQDEDARSYLLENYRELQAFAQHCTRHGLGAVLQFS